MSRGCYHDPGKACGACSYFERRIADLENSAWRRNSIARILVQEPDNVFKVAQIRSIVSTEHGLVITVV